MVRIFVEPLITNYALAKESFKQIKDDIQIYHMFVRKETISIR